MGGGKSKIPTSMLDTGYDGRRLYSRQVFSPVAGKEEGWAKLAKSLKALRVIDDRGIESLRVMEVV